MEAKEQYIPQNHLKVVKIVDGEGLIVSNIFNKEEFEIRFLGLDAPEIKPCRKLFQDERETHIAGQLLMKLGRISMKYLFELAPPGTHISIILENDNQFDIYGRVLAYVFLSDRRCLNEIMVSDGYAKTYDKTFCIALPKYQLLNSKAMFEKRGLYSIINTF